MKINLADFDLTKTSDAERLGFLIGGNFSEQLLTPLLAMVGHDQRPAFLLAMLSGPAGVMAAATAPDVIRHLFDQLTTLVENVHDEMAKLDTPAVKH